ncbi:MAG: exodeoxyribonuclease VII large subunit [Candidatus Dojkabacteria bacterium]
MEAERLTVEQFNHILNLHVQQLGALIVEGEIVQMSITQRGGVNIELKDPEANATLRVSGYAPQISGLDSIREGMQVAVWGTPEIWEQRGLFSLKAIKILPVGAGALSAAFEKLKQKLSAEGLFAPERKREMPSFITKIALITAKGSAAMSDFTKILRENKAGLEVDFYPVHVQGKFSEREIIASLKLADSREYDAIVLTRGGGSLEDLIAFNDELLARTLFASKTPVLAAVGHEKDESIAELVSDKRGSTPSQAAYYIVSINQTFINKLVSSNDAIRNELHHRLRDLRGQLQSQTGSISSAIRGGLRSYLGKISLSSRQMHSKLRVKVDALRIHTEFSRRKLRDFTKHTTELRNKINAASRLLESYNPNAVLSRGYTLLYSSRGKVISSVDNVKKGEKVDLRLKDGTLGAKISHIIKK